MPERHDNLFAVLLAGGSGTRLWPVSRKLYPKQLANFVDENSLIQNTMTRLLPMVSGECIRIVCGRQYATGIAQHMQAIGINPDDKIIAEPCGRNTAPAILLAVFEVLKQNPEAVCGVFPADHAINNPEAFNANLAAAVRMAEAGHIVTFGIPPRYPETGYGYIEGGEEIGEGVLLLQRFVEKPDLPTARRYVKAGNYIWNSGMFTFKAAVMKAEFETYMPAMVEQVEKIAAKGKPISRSAYAALEDISIDYAIMEKTDKGVVLPSAFQWSDIGSWKSLYDFFPKDTRGNVIKGNVVAQNVNDSLLIGQGRLVAANRLDNVVVVETADAVFVSDLETSREVKTIVDTLNQTQSRETERHDTQRFAWGRQTELETGRNWSVENITIDPGAEFQFEQPVAGSTHIIVAQGTADISIGARQLTLRAGESTLIAEKNWVHIENAQEEPVVIVRVQTQAALA